MKNKWLISLGAITSSFAAMPLLAAGCSQKSLKLIKNDENLKGKEVDDDSQDDRKKAVYFSVTEEKIDLSKIKLSLLKPIEKDKLFTRKNVEGFTAYFQSFENENQFQFKPDSSDKKVYQGEPFAKLLNIPAGYTITNVQKPVYVSGKGYKNANGFIKLTQEGNGWKATFRLFRKGSKNVDPAVSTEVYELFIPNK